MKKIIIPLIVIVALVIAYYFIYFLPAQKLVQQKQEKKTFLFEKQTECKNICENLYQDDKDSLSDSTVFNPQYAYNEGKNACFYSGGWININPISMTKRVVNCQSNEEVLTFMTINNEVVFGFCETCVNSSEEYDMREKEFMGK